MEHLYSDVDKRNRYQSEAKKLQPINANGSFEQEIQDDNC